MDSLESIKPTEIIIVYCTNAWATANGAALRDKLAGAKVMFRNKQFYGGETEQCDRIIMVGPAMGDGAPSPVECYGKSGAKIDEVDDETVTTNPVEAVDPITAAVDARASLLASIPTIDDDELDAILVDQEDEEVKAAAVAEKNRRTKAADASSSDTSAKVNGGGRAKGKGTPKPAAGDADK